MIQYRTLQKGDLQNSLLDDFERYQTTTHIFKRTDAGLMIDHALMVSDWDEAAKTRLIEEELPTYIQKGIIYAAFEGEILAGFAAALEKRYGSKEDTINLAMCYVSAPYRCQGIGSQLFKGIAQYAKKNQCSKLYISAHPSMQTQLFYKRMGCTLAGEYIADISAASPSDIPLEYKL